MTAVVLTTAMVLTAGVWQAPKAEADIYLSEGLNRVSVHDPSIFKDKDTNTYYVFGSHMATGSDELDTSQQGLPEHHQQFRVRRH